MPAPVGEPTSPAPTRSLNPLCGVAIVCHSPKLSRAIRLFPRLSAKKLSGTAPPDLGATLQSRDGRKDVSRSLGDAQIEPVKKLTIRNFRNHPRDWRGFLYTYPVLSRRSRGLSIGINLNPDTACNFDCIYCQVDRSATPRVKKVNLDTLRAELEALITSALDGSIFDEPEFVQTAQHLRCLKDLAFSGDGEPTTCPLFTESVALAAELKRTHQADDVKLILITDACYLTREEVIRGLEIMDQANGEIWTKLDAGTEDYYRLINRPNYPLDHVIENIVHAGRARPVVIQSLFMRVHKEGPSREEIMAYAQRLNHITRAGGKIARVQIYTVARPPAQNYVTGLSNREVDEIAATVRRRTALPVESFYEA